MRKIILICLAVMLSLQSAALAKEAAEPVKVAVELEDGSRHKELGTAQLLERLLNAELGKKNIVDVTESRVTGEPFEATEKSAADLGTLLVFDAVELPSESEPPANFDNDFYAASGASYVIRCEVIALGLTKVEDNTLSTISTIVGTGLEFADKESVQYVGTGIGMLGYIQTKRTALNTVVNMQFIDTATGKVVWQEHFIGQAVKHHKGGKNYPDAWTRAFNDSVEDTARRIAKRVNKYVDKVVVKGKSDKSFAPKNASIGGFVVGSF